MYIAPPNPSFNLLTSGIASFEINEEPAILVFVPFMKTAPPLMFAMLLSNEESSMFTVFALMQTAPPYFEAVLTIVGSVSTLKLDTASAT